MSVAYGGPPGGAGYSPPGRVNFNWIGEAFDLFKANTGVWLLASLMALVPFLVSFLVGGVYGATAALHPSASGAPPFGRTNPFATGLPPALDVGLRVGASLYTAWLYGGIYRLAVRQVRGGPVSAADIFSGGPLLWKMLGFNIVSGFAVGIGFVLCLVPGFLMSGLLLPGYALVAEGETVGNAISRSIDAMKRDVWNAAALVLVVGLLIAVSVIPCGLGLFVTLPMFFLIGALAYRDMVGMPGLETPAPGFGTPPGAWPPAPGVWPPPPSQGG